jgi:hypothetical protein
VEDIIHTMELSNAPVVYLEPVLRTHLLEPFLDTAAQLRDSHPTTDWRWDIAFHGTLPENTHPIIENGFRVPSLSRFEGHQSRFLWNWGPGIYCSPYGTYSYSYGHRWLHGIRKEEVPVCPDATVFIFICAVLRGKIHQCESARCRQYDGLEPGYDSHRSPSQREWIVFDEKRIIPLYLMAVEKTIPEHFFPVHHRALPGCSRMDRGTEYPSVAEMNDAFRYKHRKRLLTRDQVELEVALKESIDQLGNY